MTDQTQANQPLDEERVTRCYRFLLGRELAEAEDASRIATNFGSVEALAEALIASKEFSAIGAIRRRQEISLDEHTLDSLSSILGRIRDLVQDHAPDRYLSANDLILHFLAERRQSRAVIDGTQVVLGKSMNRSGHHFLISMLLEYFGEELRYCQFYDPTGCCHEIPCRRPRSKENNNSYFIQKSHDIGMQEPLLPEHKHIVQYRHPIGRAQSGFERAVRDQRLPHVQDDPASFRAWLEKQTGYFIAFYSKYIHELPPHAILIDYDEMLENPERILSATVQFIGDDPPDEERVASSVGKLRTYDVHRNRAFTPRKVDEHRYFDRSLFGDVEERIARECPRLTIERQFS